MIVFIVGFDGEDMINQNAPPGFKCDDEIIITNFGKWAYAVVKQYSSKVRCII